MAIRVSGLVSGLDTDSMVQELVSAYSMKKDKHVKAQTKLEWKMDAWKELNKKVNTLYKRLGNMKLSSYYNKKTTTVSDPTKATVVAGNNAMNGSQTLTIDKIANTGYITGAQLAKGTTANSTLGELGMASGDGTISITTGGKTSNIEVSSTMTVTEFVSKLQEAGVSASYDSGNNRLHISSKKSGKDNDFSLTATDANGLSALKSMGVYVPSDAGDKIYNEWKDYAVYQADGVTLDEAATKQKFADILDTIAKYQGDATDPDSIAAIQEKNTDLRTDITNLQADRTYALAYQSVKDALDVEENGIKKLDPQEQEDMFTYLKLTDAELEEVNKTADFEALKNKLGYSDEDFAQLRTNAMAVKQYETADDVDSDVVDSVHDSYANGDMDGWYDQNAADIQGVSDDIRANNQLIEQKQQYIQDNALLTGSAPVTDTSTTSDRAEALFDKLDFILQSKGDTNYSQGAQKINGSNAQITLNGVTYESESNDITVNGMTITALQQTAAGETLTITTQANVQGIYDSIKDFLKEYNALIKEMDQLYNADSSKGYEPLTDDEKDAMSDKEVEKWEEKIKKSILRRDDTLSTVMNLMTTTMSQGFTLSDGKKYSLASFGIKTQGYLASAENEGYVFHIDGDTEDEVSAGNNGGANPLLAALQSDPEKVQEFFQKLSDDLYTKLDKKMQSTTLNSKFSIYHDKTMKKEYDEYSKTIKKWEQKVSDMEEYYYKKFAAMEKALSSLQSSTSALSGLLGS